MTITADSATAAGATSPEMPEIPAQRRPLDEHDDILIRATLQAPAAAQRRDVPAAPPAAPPAAQPWLATLQAIWHDVPGLLSDRIELLSLELQRAGIALAKIAVLLVAVAILGVTVWLALWSAVLITLVKLGLPIALALIGIALVNLLAIWAGTKGLRRQLPLLRLPATRRHLMLPDGADHVPPDSVCTATAPAHDGHETDRPATAAGAAAT